MIPRGPDDFDAHQEAVASWAGYPDARSLNADHDKLHAALAKWLGVPSQALRQAWGLKLSREEQALASMEEECLLTLQRYVRHAGAEVPL